MSAAAPEFKRTSEELQDVGMTEALVDVDLALELLRGGVAAERQLLLLDDLQRHVLWRANAGAAVPVPVRAPAPVPVHVAASRSSNGSRRVAVARGGAQVARELHFTAGALAQRAQHLEAPDARARAGQRHGAVDRRAVRE